MVSDDSEWMNSGGFPQQYPTFDVYYNNEDVPYHFHIAHVPAAFPGGPIGDPLAEPIPNNHNARALNATPPRSEPASQGSYPTEAEKHRRHASQDINPTPPKRTRGHNENRAPPPSSNPDMASPPKPRRQGAGASKGGDGTSGEGAASGSGEVVEGAVSKGAGKAKAARSRTAKGHQAGKASEETSVNKHSGETAKAGVKAKARGVGEKVRDGFESDSGGGGGSGGHWNKHEVDRLLHAILGNTPITEFAKFEKNPSRYCKRVSTVAV